MNERFDRAEKTHSTAGIISVVAGLATAAATLALFLVSQLPAKETLLKQKLDAALFFFALFAAPVLHSAALIFALAGAFVKTRKKLFPVVGIVFNTLSLVWLALVWIVFFWTIMAVLVLS